MKTEKAIFAAGCFWHVQLKFSKTHGVLKSTAGYTGGNTDKPKYGEVSTGITGHIEAVEIEYNKNKISYEELIKKFFKMHDPTSIDRQGIDKGTQYNSVIFYFNQKQKAIAEKLKEELIKKGIKVATRIKKAKNSTQLKSIIRTILKNNLKACSIK